MHYRNIFEEECNGKNVEQTNPSLKNGESAAPQSRELRSGPFDWLPGVDSLRFAQGKLTRSSPPERSFLEPGPLS